MRKRLSTMFHKCWGVLITANPLIAVFLFFLALDLFARAGGGGKYSGRRSGGGSSFGGGGGGGDGDGIGIIIFLLIRLAIEHPVIGIPLLVIGVPAVIYFGYKSKNKVEHYHQGRTIQRTHEVRDRISLDDGLSSIRRQDSNFDKGAFLDRIKIAFMKLQDAWSKQDLGQVRAFISDGIYERFSLQINDQKAEGVRDHMEEINVSSMSIAHAEVEKVFETITVRINASAVDYQVDLKTGKRVSGSKRSDSFVEYWTFIRKPGAEMKAESGLIEGNCPNCGAALQVNESAKCPACQAVIKSGEYDWILSEITQESEWQAGSKSRLPGVDKLQRVDRHFSVQQLEDRASVMFWRYVDSLCSGRIDPIRKMATDECCDALLKKFAPNEKGVRYVPGDTAVGAVDTLGIAVDEPMDRALVKVRWSATRISVDSNGKKKVVAQSTVMTDMFVLARTHGATAAQEGALSSAHCPNCGAPVSDEVSDACDYCNTVLNDGNSDWVLVAVAKPHDDVVSQVKSGFHGGLKVASAGTPIREEVGGMEVAAWLLKVMLADGHVDDKERELLHHYADARHIPRSQMDAMIETAAQGHFECPEPQGTQECRQWMGSMARMALADGFVSKDEEAALLELGKHLDYSAYDVKHVITEERKLMYRESKQVMRQIKMKSE
jgi:uncharacterized tellurite resistance protein B-like protein